MFLIWNFHFIILVPLKITDNTDKIKITFTFKKAVQSIPYWKLGWRVDEADKTANATLQKELAI